MNKRYIIIGNSAAGIAAVEGIRQIDSKGAITILSSEKHHTYSRPLISYLLKGNVTNDGLKYRSDSFYSDYGCTLFKGSTAVRIDPKKKRVALDSGEELLYDELLIATGSRPNVPTIEGLNQVKSKHTFFTLDDALGLGDALGANRDKRVLIVGAGLVGLKCAEGILSKAAKVTIVNKKVLGRVLDDESSEIVQKHMEKNGLEFRLGATIKSFDNNSALLESGDKIDFDILVLATGATPNVELLQGITDIDRGILINQKSKTTNPHIYAAGDCTQTADISDGVSKVMALLPNAYLQGECAGINMAGGDKTFDKAIPMNAVGFFGLNIITAGNYTGDSYIKRSDNSYKRIFYGDNKLSGFIMVGDVDKAGIYTSLIRERTPLDTLDFSLICQKPGLMAFAKEARGEILRRKAL